MKPYVRIKLVLALMSTFLLKSFSNITSIIQENNQTFLLNHDNIDEALRVKTTGLHYIFVNQTNESICFCNDATFYINSSVVIEGKNANNSKQSIIVRGDSNFIISENGDFVLRNLIFEKSADLIFYFPIFFRVSRGAYSTLNNVEFKGDFRFEIFGNNLLFLINTSFVNFTYSSITPIFQFSTSGFGSCKAFFYGLEVRNSSSFALLFREIQVERGYIAIFMNGTDFFYCNNFSLSKGLVFERLEIENLFISNSNMNFVLESKNVPAYKSNGSEIKFTAFEVINTSFTGQAPIFSFSNYENATFLQIAFKAAILNSKLLQLESISYTSISFLTLLISIFKTENDLLLIKEPKHCRIYMLIAKENRFEGANLLKGVETSYLIIEMLVVSDNYFIKARLATFRNVQNGGTINIIVSAVLNNRFQGFFESPNFLLFEGAIVLIMNETDIFSNENKMLGAYLAFNNISRLDYISVRFSFNIAYYGANIINFEGSRFNIFLSTFKENRVLNGETKAGGIVFLGEFLNCINSHFIKNSAGASTVLNFEKNQGSEVVFENCSVRENYARNAAITLWGLKGFRLLVKNSTFFNNTFEIRGLIYFSVRPSISDIFQFLFIDSSFIENGASLGGVFFVYTTLLTFNFNNCIFLGNKAELGAVFFLSTEANNYLYVSNCFFMKNKALESAVYHIILGVLVEENCLYVGNVANKASTTLIQSYSFVSFRNSLIKNAYSEESFNIVSHGSSTLYLINIAFVNCSSKERSAGFAFFSMAEVICSNCSFVELKSKTGTIVFGSSAIQKAELLNCLIINSISESDALFHLKLVIIVFETVQLIKNKGNLLSLIQSDILIKDLIVTELVPRAESYFYIMKALYRSKVIVQGFILNGVTVVGSTNRKYLITVEANSLLGLDDAVITPKIQSESLSLFNIQGASISFFKIFFISRMPFLYAIESDFLFNSSVFASNSSFSLYKITAVTLEKSTFQLYGCLFSNFSNSAIKIFGCKNNTGQNLVNSSVLKFSASTRGGALFIEDSHIILDNNKFENNEALVEGGAVYLDCKYDLKCIWRITRSLFLDNKAQAGASIFWKCCPPILDQETESFLLKNIHETKSISSAPVYLQPAVETDFNQFSNFVSGDILLSPLKFLIKDFYRSTLTHLNFGNARIVLTEKNLNLKKEFEFLHIDSAYSILGITIANCEKGVLQYDSVRFVGPVNTRKTVIIETEILSRISGFEGLHSNDSIINQSEVFYQYFNTESLLYSFIFYISFSSCRMGQIYNQQTHLCYSCLEGTFSLSTNDSTCTSCPENAYCPGGSVIIVRQGFWRSSNTSATLLKCNLGLACKGGYGDDACAEGFTGPLCDVCGTSRHEDKTVYYRDMDELCKNCASADIIKSYVMVSIIGLFSIFYVCVIIKEKLSNSQNIHSDLLKIFTEYIQINSLLFSMGIDFPIKIGYFDVFASFMKLMDIISMMGTIECIPWLFLNEYNIFFKKLILVVVLTVCSGFIILFIVFAIALSKKKNGIQFKKILMVSYLIIFHSYQPSLIKTMFGGLKCQEIEGKSYLSKYLAEECWSETHSKIAIYLILPFLSMIMIIIPGMFLRKMYLMFKRNQNVEAFNFWSGSYKRDFYYWDFFLMLQKYMLISSLTFIKLSNLRIIFNDLIIFLCFYFNQRYAPYRADIINRISALRWCTALAAVLHFTVKSNKDPPVLLAFLGFWIFFIANLAFFLYYLKCFYLLKKNFIVFLHKYLSICPIKAYYINDITGETVYFDKKKEEISYPSWIKKISEFANMSYSYLRSNKSISERGTMILRKSNQCVSIVLKDFPASSKKIRIKWERGLK